MTSDSLLEFEKQALSGVMVHGFNALTCEATPDESFFTLSAHRALFEQLWERYLNKTGSEKDEAEIIKALTASGQLQAAGGAATVLEIRNLCVGSALASHAFEELATAFQRRQARSKLTEALQAEEQGEPLETVFEIAASGKVSLGASAGRKPLAASILSESELASTQITPRESLMGDWFRSADYGVIFGRRGLGKSWLAMGLARALAEGRPFGAWQCQTPRRVLYVDGEMSLDDFRNRVATLSEGNGDFLTLSHQTVFVKTGKTLCLSERNQQAELTSLCERERIDVLFLDNGAALFRGVRENDADDFRDLVEGWLLDLRRRGIAVVLIVHAGRNGHIRGTSKREDAAFWILRLDEVSGGAQGERDGATFITRFVKNRNATQDPPPMEWHFTPNGRKTLISCKQADSLEIFRQWIRDGLTTCSELAEEMGVSKGTVSKMAKKALDAGWLIVNGRSYKLVDQ